MAKRKELRQLLDFDIVKLRRADAFISWKALASEVGVSEDSLQRRCLELGITLPRWGPRPTSPVFLPRRKIVILRELYFACGGLP